MVSNAPPKDWEWFSIALATHSVDPLLPYIELSRSLFCDDFDRIVL